MESYHTERGPQQRVVAYLGPLDEPREGVKQTLTKAGMARGRSDSSTLDDRDRRGGGGPELSAAIVPSGILEVASFSDSSPTGQKALVGRFPVATRRWHHFVITFQAKDPTVTGQGTVTAYLDNRQIGKQDKVSLTSAMRLSEGALIFGAAYKQHQSDAWHQALDGQIADIQVFDTRLSEEQVSRMWQEIAP